VTKFYWPGRGPAHTCVRALVNPGGHLGLSEIGPVELTGRVRRAIRDLEHHRARCSPVIAPRAAARCCELLKGRGHDDPDPPIGGADIRALVWRPRRRFHDHRGQAGGSSAEAGRVSPGADLTMLAGMAFPIQVVLVDVSRGGRSPAG
jgi:hypothetical protein